MALTAQPETTHLHRLETINAAADAVRARFTSVPDVAIVLGTGLGGLAREIEVATSVEYADIPGYCKSASLEEIASHSYVLTPGRYVGSEDIEGDDGDFATKLEGLKVKLIEQLAEGQRLSDQIRLQLDIMVP